MTKFTPLHPAALPYYQTRYADLPPDLIKLIESRTLLRGNWDDLTPTQRQQVCMDADFRDDPRQPAAVQSAIVDAVNTIIGMKQTALDKGQSDVVVACEKVLKLLDRVWAERSIPETPPPSPAASANSERGLHPKTHQSLLKITGALAYKYCGVRRGQNQLAKVNIVTHALSTCGVSLDEDTVSKHLNHAFDLIGPFLPMEPSDKTP